MVFGKLENIDVNLYKDTTQGKNTSKTCIWFTIPLSTYTDKDEVSGEEVTYYEYISFPQTAEKEEDFEFFTLDYPYFPNIKYVQYSM